MTADLASLVLAVDSRQVKEGEVALDKLTAAGKRTEDQTKQTAASVDVLTRLYRDLGVAAATYKVLDMAKEAAMLNARYQELGVVQAVVGKSAGYTAQQMEQAAISMQKLGISMLESRNTTVQLAQAQISLADAGRLARVAQDTAVIGNINSSEALQRMVYGIKSGQIEVLRTIGINVNFEQSYKKLADELHKTTAALSEKEKMHARENAVLEEGAKLNGAYEAAMGTAGKQIRSMTRYMEDLKVMRGEVFNEALTVGVMAFVEQLKEANEETRNLSQNGNLKQWGTDVADTLAFVADSLLSVKALIGIVSHGIGAVAAKAAIKWDITLSADERRRMQANIDAEYDAYVDGQLNLTHALRDSLAARRAAQAKDTADRLALDAEYAKKALIIQKAYAGYSIEIQRAAQLSLAQAMYPQGFPTAPKEESAALSPKGTDKVKEFVAALEKEAAALGHSTVEKKLNEAAQLKLTSATMAHVKALLLEMSQYQLAEDKAKDRADKRNKEYEDILKFQEAEVLRSYTAVNAADKAVAQAQREYDQFGLLKSTILELGLVEMERRAKNLTAGTVAYENLQREIEAQRKLIEIATKTEARDAGIKAAKDAADAWKRASDQVQQSLTDALMNAFQAGKGFGKTFVNSIKAMFNTMVLRPVISAIVSPVAGAVTSALGFSGAANAATSGLSGVSNLLSTGSSIYQLGSSVAGGMSMANATGSMLANATGTGLDGLLALNGAYGTASGMAGVAGGMAGAYAGAIGGGSIAAGSQAAMLAAQTGVFGAEGLAMTASAAGAAAGSGLMTALAPLMAAAPYLAAVVGIYMLAKKLGHSGKPHVGAGSGYSAAGGLLQASQGAVFNSGFTSIDYSASTEQFTTGIVQSIVGILDTTATTFGKQAGYMAAASFADDSGGGGAWGSLFIKNLQGVITDWQAGGVSFRTFSDGSAGNAEYLAAVSADVRKALDGIGLPAWAKKVLNDLPDGATLQQLGEAVALINKTQAVFTNLGQAMAGFATIGDVGRGRLVEAAGGIDALAASASAYYQAMYTEEEKAATVKRQYTEALQAVNLAVPTTIEAYRAQVAWHESLADTEPGAAKVLATLYAMGPAFASVNQPAAELAGTVVDTVEEISTLEDELKALRNPVRSIQDVARGVFDLQNEGKNLQVELWRAYGDSNSLLAANKLQRDIETAGMAAQEIAEYDLNVARRAEIDTIVAGRQAIADGVASWESYFNQFGTEGEKQARAKTRVQAVLPADVDTVQEYKDYVWQLTEQFGVGSAEVKKATDVAGDFALAFPAVAEVISTAITAVTDLTAYQANFYTESERLGIAQSSLQATFNALGLAMPTTNAGFRALVDAQDLTTASGITTFNTLMNVQGAFAQLYPMVQSVATAATVLTTDLAAFHSGFFTTAEQVTLSSDAMNASLTALGVTNLPTTNAEFRALALGIDTSTDSGKALFNGLMGLAGAFAQLHPLVTTVTEVVQTLDGAIASLRASGASRTVEQIASNMLTLEDQIFQLQNAGNTPALRQRTLEGLSDVKDSITGLSERDLQSWVWSLQDAAQAVQDTAAANQTAADEMQRAADAAAAAAQRIASEHDGLWRQWLTATGDTAALRALDLAALDPANRALQEQIWALEDQKTAADEATTAAEQMKSAWASLTDSMLDEVRRIRGVIDESSGSGYASLAAQFATATAQTRAGDQAAAKLLPGLSQSMLTAYESSASTLVDLQRVRALTANSLETTASLVSGVAPNGYGTAVLAPADAGPGTPAAQAAAQTTELQALRTEVAALRTALEAVVINTGKSTRLQQKWDDVGIPVTNPPDGAPLSVA